MRRALLLARRDVRALGRSWLLASFLVLYPLAATLLVGHVIVEATRDVTVAVVNKDESGDSLEVGGTRFGIDDYRKQAEAAGINVVDMTEEEAEKALADGQLTGVVVIPPGFFAKLATLVSPARIEVRLGPGDLAPILAERVRGSVYLLNLDISNAFVRENAAYLSTLVEGGSATVFGDTYDVLGLQPAEGKLEQAIAATSDPEVHAELEEVREFASDAQIGLQYADNALEATAAPVRTRTIPWEGGAPRLSAASLSLAIAIAIAFTAVILVGAALAGDADDAVLARVLQAGVSPSAVISGKLLLGMIIALPIALALGTVYVVAADDAAWWRAPLIAGAGALVALPFAAIGALLATLVRDARLTVLAGTLLVLPMAPLAFAPLDGALGAILDLMPFGHARELLNAAAYAAEPLVVAADALPWILGSAAVIAACARLGLRRLA